ncbi:hypothetical protein ACLKA6_012817 [Drosophila palustris]
MQRVRGISSSRVTVAIGTYQLDRRNQKIQKTRSTLPRAIVGVSRSLRTAGVADVAACVSQLLLLWSLLLLFFCRQGRQGIRCPTAQDRPYVVKNHILHEVPLLPTKYGGSREDNSNKTRNLRCYSNRA